MHRAYSCGLVLFLVAMLTACANSSNAQRGEAQQPAAETGSLPPTTPSDLPSTQKKWDFPYEGLISGRPHVTNGTIYFAVDTGNVYAVDAESGQLKWQYEAEGQMYQLDVAIADDVVYFASQPNYLYALDGKTGEVRWKTTVDGLSEPIPTIIDGTVFVRAISKIYAVDAETGKNLWSFSMKDNRTIEYGQSQDEGLPSLPLEVTNGTIYFTSFRELYAVDSATGKMKWVFPLAEIASFNPLVAEGIVYTSTKPDMMEMNSYLYAVDAATGQEKWKKEVSLAAPPAAAKGTLYIQAKDRFQALDPTTGNEKWNTRIDGRFIPSVLTDDAAVMYTLSKVQAVDIQAGEKRWEAKPAEDARFQGQTNPMLQNSILYVLEEFGRKLYLFDAQSGKELNTVELENAIQYANVVDNVLYFVTADTTEGVVTAVQLTP